MVLDFTKNLSEGVENGVRWATKGAPMYGAVNGYVRLPEGHPWRELDLQMGEGDVEIHGGVTYGPDENGWIGFDTLHHGDVWPDSPSSYDGHDYSIRWTPERVESEARRLARKTAEAVAA